MALNTTSFPEARKWLQEVLGSKFDNEIVLASPYSEDGAAPVTAIFPSRTGAKKLQEALSIEQEVGCADSYDIYESAIYER